MIMYVTILVRRLVQQDYFIKWIVTATTNCNYNHAVCNLAVEIVHQPSVWIFYAQ